MNPFRFQLLRDPAFPTVLLESLAREGAKLSSSYDTGRSKIAALAP